MSADPFLFDNEPADDELRRLWQATPEPEAVPDAPALRRELAGRRRRLLLQKSGVLLVLLLVLPAMLWVYGRVAPGPLGTAGLLLTGLAVVAAIGRQQYAVRLFYTFPAQEAPPAYVARLRRYYAWQQRFGLRFYQAYVLLLNCGLALFFLDAYRAQPAWQVGLPLALVVFTFVMLRQYSRRYAAREQEETARLLRGWDF